MESSEKSSGVLITEGMKDALPLMVGVMNLLFFWEGDRQLCVSERVKKVVNPHSVLVLGPFQERKRAW